MVKKKESEGERKRGKAHRSIQQIHQTKQTNQYKEDARVEPKKKERRKNNNIHTYNLTLNYIQITINSIYNIFNFI